MVCPHREKSRYVVCPFYGVNGNVGIVLGTVIWKLGV